MTKKVFGLDTTMDFIKFKLATIGKSGQPQRFNYCNPLGDITKPEVSGMLPAKQDYYFGTPNMDRQENVSLVCSNTIDRSSLLLKLRWRPNKDNDITSLLTSFELMLNGIIYSYNNVETYKAQKSTIRPDYYIQYGSTKSSIKLIVLSPYRRMRLLFRGHMKKTGSEKTVFVKLNFIITTTSSTFDFLDQYNPDCFRQSYLENGLTRSYSEVLNDLLCHDRHEHSIRLAGECSIKEDSFRSEIYLWGFYSREFLSADRSQLKSSRILAHLSNGQLFHVGYNQIGSEKIPFGYTCYSSTPYTYPIDKPFKLETELDEKTEQLEVEVSGEGLSFKATGKKLTGNIENFFQIEFNQKSGWAYLSIGSEPHLDDDDEKVQLSQSEYLAMARDGGIVATQKMDSDKSPLLTNTDELDCCCADLVGSKAASLALLKKYEPKSIYKVPKAFVLTRFAYDSLLEHYSSIGDSVAKMEELVGEGETDILREHCGVLTDLIENSSLPDKLLQEVETKLVEHYGKESFELMKFAIRSSSWGEDEEDMSAAGQLKTILSVRGIESIAKAIMRCFASKFSYENVEYKRQHGLPLSLPMAVVIQEMVDCEKAGVMFTCDPTTCDDRSMVITGNYGLGESVVSGQAEPDTIKIRRKWDNDIQYEVEELKIGSKSIVVDEETLKGSDSSRQYDRTMCCLSESEALKLAECGHQLSQYYQANVDIEWGYKGDQIYLLQARPITGLDIFSEFELMHESDFSRRSEINFVTRANIGEVLPYASKPFTMTYFTYSWNILGARMFSKFNPKLRASCVTCPFEVFYDSYHAFFSLINSIIFMIEAGNQNKEKSLLAQSMQVAMFGRVIEDTSEIEEASKGIIPAENIFLGPRYEFYTFFLRKRPIPTVLKHKSEMAWLRQQVADLKLAKGYKENKMFGLYEQINNLQGYNYQIWTNHIFIVRIGGATNMELTMFLAKYIQDPNQLYSTSAKFFATSPNVISAEIPVRIERMTELIRSKGKELLDKFTTGWSTDECLEYLKHGDEKLTSEYQDFLKLFGHRAYNEFELSEKSWAMNQSVIVDMLKKSCSVEKSEVDRKKATVDEIIKSIEADCGREMEHRDKIYLKQNLVPKVQIFVAAREHTKDILVEHADIIRQAVRMLARELTRNLRIPDEDLFFYLLYDEVRPLIRQPQPAIVMQAIRRRNLFKQFGRPWLFDEIVTGYRFIPNHLKPSKELEEKVAKAPKLYGTPASSGRVEGKICLVQGYDEIHKVRAGDILLTHSTDIAFSPVFPLIKGIITEVGGLISHGAVVAREYGLPSILGIPNITRIIKDGEEIILDADNGVIVRLGLTEEA